MTSSRVFSRRSLCRNVIIYLVVTVCVISAVKARNPREIEEPHFMSRLSPYPFSGDPDTVRTNSTPRYGEFQDIFIKWIKQEKLSSDVSAITALVEVTVTDPQPSVFWFINGQTVDESDPLYPQTTTSVDGGMLVTLHISRNSRISSLKLYLHLNDFATETPINVQDMDGAPPGQMILEYGTDVAFATSEEEKVTFKPGIDIDIVMRFFAEDLPQSSFDAQEVILMRGADIFTTMQNPDVISLRNLTMQEVPRWIYSIPEPFYSRETRPPSALSLFQELHIERSLLTTKVFLFVSAGYVNDTPCRLFGGQKISRKLELVPQEETSQK